MSGGGKSSSSNSSSTSNTNVDGRQAVGDGGNAVANYGAGAVSVNVLDGGAVAGAIDLSKSGRELASKEFSEILGAAKWLYEQNTGALKETLSSVGNVYQQARETELSKDVQGSKQLLQVVGFVVVGLVALSAAKRG